MIFVLTLGVIVILAGLVLVFSQAMRTEVISSSNRASAIEADAIEQAGEQYVVAQVERYVSDAVSTTQLPGEAIRVGKGYFWLISPDAESDQLQTFGIDDESGKVNLNVAISDANSQATKLSLLNLPGMTQDVADSIFNWRSPVSSTATTTNNGAQSDYYESLQPLGYEAKNAPFETIEELLLVRDIIKEPSNGTQVSLFGYDLNRDGVIDQNERQSGGLTSQVNSGSSDSRGFYNDVTVWSVEPNTTTTGAARVSVNDTNTAALQKTLETVLGKSRAAQILAKLSPLYVRAAGQENANGRTAATGGKSTTQPAKNTIVFPNIGAFYVASGMKSTEFSQVADQLTASNAKTLPGLINVNTASAQVLACLPGLTTEDAQSLVDQRNNGADTTSIAWVFDALTPVSKAVAISSLITARSFQYSADIVAVSGDGRSFKRVRIVVDAQTVPAKIVYRRDLSGYGWPLDPRIQVNMRNGTYVPPN